MNPEKPRVQHSESIEKGHTMSEEETMTFLRQKGVESLDPETWQPHEAVLYVMEEIVRTHANGPFNDLPLDKRPSIVRVDDPLAIHFDKPLGESHGSRIVYGLESDGGQADYYVIDSTTGMPELIRTTHSRMVAPKYYHVRKETLFKAADDIFPRSST
jgi:hypothetical protein